MPKIDASKVTIRKGASYPAPFHEACAGRSVAKLGDAAGLTQFGASLVTLEPEAWASQRHWHSHEDEFVYIVQGELTLIEDNGETLLQAGDAAGWPAGVANGHHLVNRSSEVATFLVVGSRDDQDRGHYPDIDLAVSPGRYKGTLSTLFHRKDGTPYSS